MSTNSAKVLHKAGGLAGTGALCAQWVRCGTPSCRCGRGELHGPFYSLFWRESGRLRKRYVPLADVPAVAQACADRRTRERRERLIARVGWERWRALRDLVREVERDG